MLRAALTWPALLGLYLLLSGSLGANELVAGCGVATAATIFALAFRRICDRQYRPPPGWPGLIGAAFGRAPVETALVAGVLLRALVGHPAGIVATQSFPSRTRLTGDPPRDAARRGLATLAQSLSPNAYVVSADDRTLRLHRLAHGDE